MEKPFLKLTNIRKAFGGVRALKGVDLELRRGEIHCLAGENGCGKSTLIKIISGVYQPDIYQGVESSIEIDGEIVTNLRPLDAIRHGIQVIYQDFAVFPNMSVAENIGMNRLLLEGEKLINWKKTRERAIEAMAAIGASIDPDALVERLAVANKQIVAICRAIFNDAKLIILDEPTTALTSREVDMLFRIIRNLKEQNIAVLIVNHKIDEIFRIADRITILRNGEFISSGRREEYDRARFAHDLTGRELKASKYRPESGQFPDETVFEVDNLSREGAFYNVSFAVKHGDVFGITGLLGSGRGEIADAIFGLAPADSGTMQLNGETIKVKSIDDAMDHGIAYVPEDRLTQGLFLERSILDNIMAASLPDYFSGLTMQNAKMEADTNNWIKEIAIKTASAEPPINTLSGGNQQKCVLAKWLNTKPKLLVLNGPTVGVDIGSKAEIHDIVRQLAADGVGVIVISDDISELLENCNRIVVVHEGRIVASVTNEITEMELVKLLSTPGGIKDESEIAV